jgi:Glu-tRNA(Gln) amidotransferase subunit E-like FAD-binding protein
VGEKLKGLTRAGVTVSAVPAERWVEVFQLFSDKPVLAQAWEAIIKAIASDPQTPAGVTVAALGLGEPPPGWKEGLLAVVARARKSAYDASPERLQRHATGLAMETLRGRVLAQEVAPVLQLLVAATGGRA